VEVLVREVLPAVLELLPEDLQPSFVLHVVGSNIVPEGLRQLFYEHRERVIFHGNLPDEQVGAGTSCAAERWLCNQLYDGMAGGGHARSPAGQLPGMGAWRCMDTSMTWQASGEWDCHQARKGWGPWLNKFCQGAATL
jgi:hypothetical protein